jgi:hypothetical protein
MLARIRAFARLLCLAAWAAALMGPVRKAEAGGPNACCAPNGTCTDDIDSTSCPAGSTFIADAMCSPNPCPGACCDLITGACTSVTQSACTGHRAFHALLCVRGGLHQGVQYPPFSRAIPLAGAARLARRTDQRRHSHDARLRVPHRGDARRDHVREPGCGPAALRRGPQRRWRSHGAGHLRVPARVVRRMPVMPSGLGERIRPSSGPLRARSGSPRFPGAPPLAPARPLPAP